MSHIYLAQHFQKTLLCQGFQSIKQPHQIRKSHRLVRIEWGRSVAENHPFGTPRERKGLTPLDPELPISCHFSAAICQSFSSERFGVLLFSLSRCCNAGTRAAAKSLETIQRQRPSGHRRRPSQKPQQKLAGIPWHSVCSISRARMGNGRSRAQPLRSWGDRKGAVLPARTAPFHNAAKGSE